AHGAVGLLDCWKSGTGFGVLPYSWGYERDGAGAREPVLRDAGRESPLCHRGRARRRLHNRRVPRAHHSDHAPRSRHRGANDRREFQYSAAAGRRQVMGIVARLRQSSLGAKLAVLSALVTAAVVWMAFWGLNNATRQNTRDVYAEQLARNQQTLEGLQERSARAMLNTASLISQAPTFQYSLKTF